MDNKTHRVESTAPHQRKCPDDETLADLASDQLSAASRAALERHIDVCGECREVVAALVLGPSRDGSQRTAPSSEPRRLSFAADDRISRYVVTGLLGAGGMGLVYAARDPELDREVAVKVLPGEGAEAGRSVREARALAKLSHPNIVQVHDVGTVKGHVYIAMELVEGTTLREWLASRERGWREVLDVFEEVGRGINAAHGRGIVHRDIKPENIFLGRDGRTRVGDFGLAQLPASTTGHSQETGGAKLADDRALTRTATGTAVGTPAYMAPEQFLGEPATERSDQFSFCVALHQALYGARPFLGASEAALAQAVLAGELQPPPARRVPRWLYRVVRRGLERSPGDRHPSMASLLDAIASGRRRRRRIAMSIAAVAMTSVIGMGAALLRPDRPTLCTSAPDQAAQIWHGKARAAGAAAFAATGIPAAEDSWRRVAARLDAYALDWVAAHTEACEATHVRGEQSAQRLDARMACLRRRRDELAGLLEVFAAADADVVRVAQEATLELSRIDDCGHQTLWSANEASTRDPATRQQADAIAADVSRARSRYVTGQFRHAATFAREAVGRADALGDRVVLAEALLELGAAERELGNNGAAARQLHRAIVTAEAAGHDIVAAQAWVALVGVPEAGKYEDEWLDHARAAVTRVGDPQPLVARLEHAMGRAMIERDDQEKAGEHWRRARALWEQPDLEIDAHAYAGVLKDLADQAVRSSRYDDAEALYLRMKDHAAETLGADHPNVGVALLMIADVSRLRGDEATSLAQLDEAIAIWRARLGDSSPRLIGAELDRVDMLVSLERPDDARAALERLGPIVDVDDPELKLVRAKWMQSKVRLALQTERFEEARVGSLRTMEFVAANFPEHQHLNTLILVMQSHGGANRHKEAIPYADRAVEIARTHSTGFAHTMAIILTRAGYTHLHGGDKKTAARYLQEALGYAPKTANPDYHRARIEKMLAQAAR